MDQEFIPKPYPKTTAEVAALFGLPHPGLASDAQVEDVSSPHPANLPVVDVAASAPAAKLEPAKLAPAGNENFSYSLIAGNLYLKKPAPAKDSPAAPPASSAHPADHLPPAGAAAPASPALKFFRQVAPYVMVFSVGLFIYYFFFNGVNLNIASWFKAAPRAAPTAKQGQLSQLQQADLAGYQKWIAGFYYDVTDGKIFDPQADNSGNGLTNFQKYLLNLNPKSYDTLGLGRADSQSLALGINPLSGNVLTDQQKQIVEKYVDMEVVMNKLALANLQNARNVAGAQTGVSGSSKITPRGDSAGALAVPPPAQAVNALEIDTAIPGRLEIPSLKVNVPLMWTDDPKNFDRDLKSGVVHYPGTALPGEIGTTYISGHSSNYVWAGGDYNQIFNHLGDLPDSASFKVTVVQKNGKDAILHYVVTGRQEYKPTDQAQFQNNGQSVVALSTCWPVGSTAKRLVVFGELTQIEK